MLDRSWADKNALERSDMGLRDAMDFKRRAA